MSELKRYLGDGAYVDFDGESVILTTENGIAITNRIVLGLTEFQALFDFILHVAEWRLRGRVRE
jgi:hypothetical protein